MSKDFTKKLMNWHRYKNKRIMPWKGEKNPYKIWISEIILQQTRVEQGFSYYNKFVQTYPTVAALANASDDAVFKIWEGLGYYSRCRNLLLSARYIVKNLDAAFPDTYDEILKLKGVGPYTAAAIASFAYGLPHAVVDGNVFRVLSRFCGQAIPIDSSRGKAYFTQKAQQLLDKDDPAGFNQAIMDFGATVCKPKNPECRICPLQDECSGFYKNEVDLLPVKEKQLIKKDRWFTYFIFDTGSHLVIRQRQNRDIWQQLYEFYLVEAPEKTNWKREHVKQWLLENLHLENIEVVSISKTLTQKLTHQTIVGTFIHVRTTGLSAELKNMVAIAKKEVSMYSFPRLINTYLEGNPMLLDIR